MPRSAALPMPLSSTERTRLQRGFFRHRLHCRCYVDFVSQPSISPHRRTDPNLKPAHRLAHNLGGKHEVKEIPEDASQEDNNRLERKNAKAMKNNLPRERESRLEQRDGMALPEPRLPRLRPAPTIANNASLSVQPTLPLISPSPPPVKQFRETPRSALG